VGTTAGHRYLKRLRRGARKAIFDLESFKLRADPVVCASRRVSEVLAVNPSRTMAPAQMTPGNGRLLRGSIVNVEQARATLPSSKKCRLQPGLTPTKSTSIPLLTIFASASASQLVRRMQPCDTVLPTFRGSGVP